MSAEDAAALSRQAYAGLMLEEPWAAPAATRAWDVMARKEARDVVEYTVQERRALDLLATLPKIDMTRVGFVGWSYGASIGARLAGVEDRVKAYALSGVAASPTWSKRPFAKDFFHAPTGAAWDCHDPRVSPAAMKYWHDWLLKNL